MKKLYNVDVTLSFVVLADDPHGAHRAAREVLEDHGHARDLLDDAPVVAGPFRRLPPGWSTNAVPYGHGDPVEPDRTVAGWVALGAAPEWDRR